MDQFGCPGEGASYSLSPIGEAFQAREDWSLAGHRTIEAGVYGLLRSSRSLPLTFVLVVVG